MRFILVLCCILTARVTGECEVSEWSEWTEWLESYHDPTITSRPAVYDPEAVDQGRVMMGLIMDLHDEREVYREGCLADDSCPELAAVHSEGFMPCIDGLSNGTYPCWNVDQQSFLNFEDLFVDLTEDRTPSGNDAWGWHDAVDGQEYALMGTTSGVSFVRVTDPVNPEVVAFVKSEISTPITWRDFKVIGDYVFIVSENLDHGIQIFDMTRLRGRTTPAYLLPDVRYDKVGNCHNIIANADTNFVYGVGCHLGNRTEYELCRGGLHAVDVSDPLDPQYAGCFGGDGYVHDGQCVVYTGPDVTYQGREVCYCYNEDTFTIVDVEDKENMFVISSSEYGDRTFYTHQGWVSEDMTTIYLDDELDEYLRNNSDGQTKTYIWDITNMTAPVLMNTYVAPYTSIDHNQYIIDDITYQANYEAGLRILRTDQIGYTLTELAYFDVFPSRTTPLFFGSWSVYPYLPSRNLVVSSIDYGLFMLRPDYDVIDNPAADAKRVSERGRYRQIIDSLDSSCPNLVEVERRYD